MPWLFSWETGMFILFLNSSQEKNKKLSHSPFTMRKKVAGGKIWPAEKERMNEKLE